MNIRKIAVVAGFAAGAALAFAPLASADPTDITSAVDAEVASANAMFQFDSAIAGVPASDIEVGPQGFDIIKPEDVGTVQGNGFTPFDFLVYGLNPTGAGLATDPGAFNLYNGALVKFDDAYNVDLYALLNGGATIPQSAWDTDLFGSASSIEAAMSSGTVFGDSSAFMTQAFTDLLGFFGI